MITLHMTNNYIDFTDEESLVAYLAQDNKHPELSDHLYLAKKYQPAVQANAIARFPIETIITLDEKQRDALFGLAEPHREWNTLPPIVIVNDNSRDEPSTKGRVVNGQDTVWILDTSSPRTLIRSLTEFKALNVSYS